MSNEAEKYLLNAGKLFNPDYTFSFDEVVELLKPFLERDSHLRSLVGEKGSKGEIEKFLQNYYPHYRDSYSSSVADSLLPIIGGIVAAREEAIRKEGRQVISEEQILMEICSECRVGDVEDKISGDAYCRACHDGMRRLSGLKAWGVQKEGEGTK